MKIFLRICLVILIILLLFFSSIFISNLILIKDYEKGKYDHNIISYLKKVNVQEKYIVYYNEGNIKFQEKKYDEALKLYTEALKKNPPQYEKCEIVINITVTMLEMIDENADKEEIVEKLEKAIEELHQYNCANEDDTGESEEAEDFEDDINDIIEKLKEEPKDEQQERDPEEEKIEKELEEINKGANESRQQDLQDYENLGNYHFYSGKSW